MTEFAFATCLPGMEPAVKLDVAHARPALRFAYSRPGLLTFKSAAALAPDDVPATPFARVWGRSVGPARDPEDAAHQLMYLGANRVHVFARDPEIATELASWQRAIELPAGPAQRGELVADVIVAPGEPAWLGLHVHSEHHVPHAGGAIPVDVPADTPSRAFAKIEEAIAWLQLPIAGGQTALEIGAAPGGALYALARRGVHAWGVDTAVLAPNVEAMTRVHHIRVKVGALRWEQLPKDISWLLVDMNLAPQVALHEVARIVQPMRESLRAIIFTLKLNDFAFVAELPRLGDRLGELLPGARVRMRHLPSNRREICAVATRTA